MVSNKSFEKTHERILQGALEVFSEKGYSAATIKDISDKAGCNSVTIFRHFGDKLGLFLKVVERYHELELDQEYLQSRLSYTNVHADLSTMAGIFFEILLRNIHILRININDGPHFGQLSKYLWYLPAPFKNFVAEYIEALYPKLISSSDASLISEMFISFIVRTCLRVNVHEGVGEYSGQIAKEAKEVMSASVDMIVKIIKLYLKNAK